MTTPYALFDLHCDTLTAFMDTGPDTLEGLKDPARRGNCLSALTACAQRADTLDDPRRQFALCKIPREVHWAQCCAVFLPDGLDQAGAAAYYQLHRDSFYRQMGALEARVLPCRTGEDIQRAWTQGKAAALLTVENGSALAGRLERVEQLARDGVRMLTLTWNGENELGSGHATGRGLSPFGREAVPELERQGILVDVSHLNDRGLEQVLELASRPFAASHSNARAVCPHRRNLTDSQIKEMAARRCLIGLNFYSPFLRPDGRPARLDDLYRHIAHFMELGAEDCLALGSDFDGADLPPCLDGPEKAAGLYPYLLDRGISPAVCDKLLFGNALAFFRANCR